MILKQHLLAWVSLGLTLLPGGRADGAAAPGWKVGTPIVSYCMGPGFPGGPAMDDAAAAQLSEGGWNLVWCDAKDLDVVQRHGLRATVINQRLLIPAALAAPKELDALIDSVKRHPAFYGYYLALEIFDAASGQWSPVGGPRVELRLAAGGGRLVRIRS